MKLPEAKRAAFFLAKRQDYSLDKRDNFLS
jgi:hypothetical protein